MENNKEARRAREFWQLISSNFGVMDYARQEDTEAYRIRKPILTMTLMQK